MQVTASSNGVVHRDRATSGGMLWEVVGILLRPSDMAANGQNKSN